MRHCQKCGGFVLQIERGGCGGNGSFHRCSQCGQVYHQESGGIVSTPGGEIFRPLADIETELQCKSLPTLEEWKKQLLEKSKQPWSIK